MKIKKLHENAVIPQRAHDNDAGYDLVAINNGDIEVVEGDKNIWRMLYIEYKTGLAIEPPVGYHIEMVARSSISKTDLILANCVAIGDQGYRGEYRLRFKIPVMANKDLWAENEKTAIKSLEGSIIRYGIKKYKIGDKIGQMLIRKTEIMEIQEVDELSDSVRGEGGFGSSDVQDQLNSVANDPDVMLVSGKQHDYRSPT